MRKLSSPNVSHTEVIRIATDGSYLTGSNSGDLSMNPRDAELAARDAIIATILLRLSLD